MASSASELESSSVASTVRDKAVNAIRQAAHVAHETSTLKTLATDAFEDGVYAAKRALKTAQRSATDVRDEVTYRVKREPMKALGAAFGFGVLAGVAVGWIGGYRWTKQAAADE